MQSTTASTSLFATAWYLIKLIFSVQGATILTLLLIAIVCINSGYESYKQKSPEPFIKAFGGRIVNYEQVMYYNAKQVQANGGIVIDGDNDFVGYIKAGWEIFKSFGSLIISVWTFYTIVLVVFTLIAGISNQPSKFCLPNIILTILIILMLEVSTNYIIVNEKYQYSPDTHYKFIPFKGIWESIKTLPLITQPIYQHISDTGYSLVASNATEGGSL